MAGLIETLNSISSTMDALIDFAVNDKDLSKDFENFLIKNDINIERQNELNDCIINYILDEKMQDNTRVLDYFLKKNQNADINMISSFKKSFKSVFRVNKILKNAYSCTCLANEMDFELIPLVKMTNLRGIGLYDFIKARIVELNGVFYLLEIFDCFGQFREYQANVETVKCLIKYPESQTMYNDKKLKELQNSTGFFYEKFMTVFSCDEIITTNTLADDFIKEFNLLIDGKIQSISKEKYIKNPEIFKYFKLNEDYEDDFIKNATGGFSASEKAYDIGFFMDKTSGLYIVPFLGTVNEILKQNSLATIENAKECIENFMLSDKVSPNLIIKKNEEFKGFIPLINKAFDKDFKDIREIINFFRQDWIIYNKFSPTMVLYNSKTFEKLIGMESKEKSEPDTGKNIGRNDPCPCGSGKKYKNCCLNV